MDIIFSSLKKILQDENLPLSIKYDNNNTDIRTYKAMFDKDYPMGSININILNYDNNSNFNNSIVGLTFDDIYGNSYTITEMDSFGFKISPELKEDFFENDVVELRSGNELKIIQLMSSFNLNKSTISNKMRYRVKGFDVYLIVNNDPTGEKSEALSLRLNKLFSKQAYPCYDENGNPTGEHFNIELSLNFVDISTVDYTKILLSRLRFGKYEDFRKI